MRSWRARVVRATAQYVKEGAEVGAATALLCGAIIAIIIGFAWGGWTTFGTTQTKTKEAVLASQAAMCVAQSIKQPNHEGKLKELEAIGRTETHHLIL